MKSIVCENIIQNISNLFTCSIVNGFVRIRTPFILSDGSLIDIFIKEQSKEYILTDLGETLGWLNLQTILQEMPKKQKNDIKKILKSFNVEHSHEMFIIRVKKNVSESELSSYIFQLAQAIIKVAETSNFYKIAKLPNPIIEDVSILLRERKIDFETNKRIRGNSGRVRKIDFYFSNSKSVLINILSANHLREANRRSDYVFSTWFDLSYRKTENSNFISLIEDNEKIWSSDNINLLNQVSNVVFWSEKSKFQSVLQ